MPDSQKIKDTLFIAIVRAFLKPKQEQPEHLKMKQFEARAIIDGGFQNPVTKACNEDQARKKLEKEFPGIQIITLAQK